MDDEGKDLTKIENMMYAELVSLKKRIVGGNTIRHLLWSEALIRFMKDELANMKAELDTKKDERNN